MEMFVRHNDVLLTQETPLKTNSIRAFVLGPVLCAAPAGFWICQGT
jgi:hypothetical protein